jgi:hypothetical protein
MVICFDASLDAKNALEELMRSGEFKNISEAVSMSLLNYQVIRNAVAESGGHTMIETANRAGESRNGMQVSSGFGKIPELFRRALDRSFRLVLRT